MEEISRVPLSRREMRVSSGLKFLTAGINIILFLLGLAIAGTVGYLAFNGGGYIHHEIFRFGSRGLINGIYVLFSSGLILEVASLVGLVGAAKEKRSLIVINIVLMLLIFIIQLVGVTTAFTQLNKMETFLRKRIRIPPSSKHLKIALESVLVNAKVESLERRFKCCGIDGPMDYDARSIPNSCYPLGSRACPSIISSNSTGTTNGTSMFVVRGRADLGDTTGRMQPVKGSEEFGSVEERKLYKNGCRKVVWESLHRSLALVVVALAFEMAAIILSCCNVCYNKRGYTKV